MIFFENETRKAKQVNICELSLLDFILYIFVSLAHSQKIVTKVNQIRWLIGWNYTNWMAKKQLNVNVNKSFLQTVDDKVMLKEIRTSTIVNVPVD